MRQHNDDKVTLDEIYTAYLDFRKKKKNKRGTKSFEPMVLDELSDICNEINERRYVTGPSECFIIKYPVIREVFCALPRDRVVQHFIYNELNPVIEKLIIKDTASCRKNKGTDYAIKRVQRFVRRETNNYTDIENTYFCKMDISGFFMSIDRKRLLEKVLWVVDNKYQGKHKETLHYLLPIVILSDVTKGAIRLTSIKDWDLLPPNKTLFGNDRGLPIGNITSQLFANYYLNDIDHFIKSRYKSFERYVDDMIIVGKNKSKLIETKLIVNEKLKEYNMRLNLNKSIVSDVKYGINFLGIKIYPHYSILGKKRVNRLWYTTSLLRSIKKAYTSCASRKGMFIRYHGRRVARRWYNSLPSKWRKKLKMDSNAQFHLYDKKIKPNKNILRNVFIYNIS